ncbi:hypothetical protein ITJ38_10040 [Agreia pratensis]|uniref:hypothetical protein n=1 Tax=Agreia pratensis TaxID=150121 RepID=UPI00188B3A86|nr:hypothetical protein [Agreia pratensis]MBF4634740.1 hypothetical protein [Agreia pratensis]
MTPTEQTALLHPRAADTFGDVDVISPRALSDSLREGLAANGYRQLEDDIEGTLATYRLGDGEPERVPVREFRQVLRPVAIELATTLAGSNAPGARRARATARLLTRRERGAESYLRALAEHARDRLPEIVPASAEDEPPAPDPLDLVAAWLPTLQPGRLQLGDAWRRWNTDHPDGGIGRTNFYAALTDLGDVVNGGQRRRYLVTPPTAPEEAPVIDNLREDTLVLRAYADEAERALAAHAQLEALLEQRDRLGAPIVDELAARRARRSA